MTDTVPTGDVGTITKIDFDGFLKARRLLAMVNGSSIWMITLRKLKSNCLGLDGAIFKGWLCRQTARGHLIQTFCYTKQTDISKLVNVVKKLTLIDTGEVHRGLWVWKVLYYNRFVGFSIQVDASGNTVGN